MRNIKKRFKVQVTECTYYDRNGKEEKTSDVEVLEGSMPELPENCVLLDSKVIYEKEIDFSMTPETFIKHATKTEK